MPLEHVGRDVYMRHTDSDGKSRVVQHRCWDAKLFVASQQRAVDKVNTDARNANPPQPAKAKVEQITEDQYKKERA